MSNFEPSLIEKFQARLRPNGDCVEWTGGLSRKGYGMFYIGANQYVKAHRFAYELANGPIPEGQVIRHACDNKRCCRKEHLLAGGALENNQDKAHRATIKTRRLTKVDVSYIHDARAAGASVRTIGKSLGVCHQLVHNVIVGKTYYGEQYG